MNTKRIPQDSAWNFDSDIIWVGLINAYDKASNMYSYVTIYSALNKSVIGKIVQNHSFLFWGEYSK